MKILFLSTYKTSGGAAIAATRTYSAISNLVYNRPQYNDISLEWRSSSLGTWHNLKNHISQRLFRYLSNASERQSIDIFYSRIHHAVNKSGCDLVHIHWCHDEFLPIESILKIQKPIVWTLHDHWPFQGSHHLPSIPPEILDRLLPHTNRTFRPQLFDFDSWCLRRKSLLSAKDITFTAPSSWLCRRLTQSKLFHSQNCLNIPNPVESVQYLYSDKTRLRNQLGLPTTRRLVLYVANNFTTDVNKGFILLLCKDHGN